MANRWGKSRSSDSVSSSVPKSLWTVTAAMKSEACFLGSKLWQTYSCIKKQRHHFAYKVPYSQGNGLSSCQWQIWKLDNKEGRAPKYWWFLIVVLEMTLESPLDCKEIKPVNLKGNKPSILWKDWCWSWSSNTSTTWCVQLIHWKRPWCWERSKAEGEEGHRGWDGRMESLIQWTWT